jgi:REP element-mobilizing transposase RayT
MSECRRYFVAGAAYFVTLVTQRRARVFASTAARG